MRIGQFVWFGIGGVDRAAENLVKGLQNIKDIELLVFYNEFSFPKKCSQWDTSTEMLCRKDNYGDIPLIRIDNLSELNNYNLDILNTHRPGNDFWALPGFESTTFNFKVVETNFHGYMRTKADFRIFPSRALMEKKGIQGEVIPNAIGRPVTEENLRDELGIGDKFVFGRIGRACSEVYSSINLWAYKLVEADDTVFLYVSPHTNARRDAENLGIKNIIFLEQTIDEIKLSKIYNTFDLLCHSNGLGETFGNTIAEAMIHGKPVISHRGSPKWTQAQVETMGVPELFITDNIVSNYAAVMQKLKCDRGYYNRISAYMKNRADELYSYEKVAQRYATSYRRILRL